MNSDPMLTRTEKCYVCQSTHVKGTKDREGFVHLACEDCYARWLHPEQIVSNQKFYTEEYFSGRVFRESGGKFGYPESYTDASTTHRATHYSRYIDKINRLFDADRNRTLKALDFGCGYGFFLKALVEQMGSRVEVSGIELDSRVCNRAKTNLNGAPVYCIDLKAGTGTVPRNYFDVITMLDVLEHLDDPRIYLQRLTECAKSKGYLLLSTTNIESFNARLYGERWVLYSPPYHIYYFGLRSIRILLQQTGWRIVDLYTERTIFHNEHSIMESWRGKLARALFQNRLCDLLTNRVLHIGSIMVVVAQRI